MTLLAIEPIFPIFPIFDFDNFNGFAQDLKEGGKVEQGLAKAKGVKKNCKKQELPFSLYHINFYDFFLRAIAPFTGMYTIAVLVYTSPSLPTSLGITVFFSYFLSGGFFWPSNWWVL